MGFAWPEWLTPKAWRPASSPIPSPAPSVPGQPVGDAWWHEGIPHEVIEMSAAFEAFRAAPYRDSGGVWTIGLGSTRDAAGRPVTASTPPVTRAQAEAMARRDLTRAEMLVRQAFPAGLPVRWAAVCILLANNMGSLTAKAQTLVGLLHARKWRQAADTLRIYRNAGGVPQTGLRRRRWAEAAYAQGMPMAEAYRLAWSKINSPDDWPTLPG